ncbi:MAG TPA: 4-hydroxybenzoate octaprenyltransferase, partial [Alcanivorax sp.]|nr:4-hydroxybenzoate octaprenyltransferase [Alcanivorax sp.]
MLAFVEHRYPALWPWIQLMRLDRPIGSMLLMWPTLWALWIAGGGTPSLKHIVIFV